MATNFDNALGVDFHCIDDLDASLSIKDTRVVLGESVARRLITPRGGLFYDRNYGYDIRRYFKAGGLSRAQLARLVEAEIYKDERVKSAAVGVEWDRQDEALTVDIRLTPVTGQAFQLTITVDDLTVELLSEDVV